MMDISIVLFVCAALATIAFLVGAAVGRRTRSANNEIGPVQLEAARLAERAALLDRQLADERGRRSEVEAGAKAAGEEVARLRQRESDLTAQLSEVRMQLTTEFENIANRILKARTSELSETSKKDLGAILDPLRERLTDFQNKIEITYASETREVLSLKAEIKQVLETSNAIGNKADGLANALRGQSQVRGRWGEVALERILEAAGLIEGREYIRQGRGLGLRSEEGDLQRPDILILLPDEHSMVIDSKVTLAAYERLIAATDEGEQNTAGVQFVRDVKTHINDLSNKRYQDNSKLVAHDCVLMFVPIEGALAAALTRDTDLFNYAWSRRVVLVGPSTLLMTMRTVASIWHYELQGQNAQEIAKIAGELIDKIRLSIDDLNVVATKINEAMGAHNEAVKRFATGRGNALSLGARIQRLGGKARRPMSPVLIDGAEVSAEDCVDDEIPVVVPTIAAASASADRSDAAD